MSVPPVNPAFANPVGSLIERATDPSQTSENWALNLEICDQINERPEGPKDAMRAIRKRLTSNAGKNNSVVWYTLIVLETCVKNCGRRFHVQMATKEFMHDLVKIIAPKNDPPQNVQDKVLTLIQTWNTAFRFSSELKEIEKVYSELVKKGVQFPPPDPDDAPIRTPRRSSMSDAPGDTRRRSDQQMQERQHSVTSTCVSQHPRVPSQVTPHHGMYPVMGTSAALASYPVAPNPGPARRLNSTSSADQVVGGPVVPTSLQVSKLEADLRVVEGNVRVLNEMLTYLMPDSIDREEIHLLHELNRTCRQMQTRIVELLVRVHHEELTAYLLRANDDLNNAFLRYDRFEKFREAAGRPEGSQSRPLPAIPDVATATSESVTQEKPGAATNAEESVGQLIDFSSPDDPADHRGPPPAYSVVAPVHGDPFATSEEDDFAALAQSRLSQVTPANPVETDPSTMIPGVPDRLGELEEMEQWMQEHEMTNPAASGIGSDEFDQFLSDQVQRMTTGPSQGQQMETASGK